MRDGSEPVGDEAGGRAEFRQSLVAQLLMLREHGSLPTAVVREAARAAAVSERTVWRWLRDGTGSATRRASCSSRGAATSPRCTAS
jgi:hypothetical protein